MALKGNVGIRLANCIGTVLKDNILGVDVNDENGVCTDILSTNKAIGVVLGLYVIQVIKKEKL